MTTKGKFTAAAITAALALAGSASSAQADASTCTWWQPGDLCINVKSVPGAGNQITRVSVTNRTSTTLKVRIAAERRHVVLWQSLWDYVKPGQTRLVCESARPWGTLIPSAFGEPCHVWPTSLTVMRPQKFASGAWRPAGTAIDVKP